MGLIKLLKRLFRKPIALKDLNSKHLVTLVKSNEKLEFGATLDVGPNFACALVYKNKVADVFNEGRYRLDTNIMPLLSRMQKLNKPNRKGNLPKYFRADIYYVNLKVFENAKFDSTFGFVVKDKIYKNFSCKPCGTFSYQVISPVDFMESMFMSFGILRDGIAKAEISNWVDEATNKILRKKKLSVIQLYSKDDVCFENLAEKLNKELFDVGLKITDYQITDLQLPKKLLKKLSVSQEDLQQKPKDVYVGEQHDLNNPVKDAMEKDFENQSNQTYFEVAEQIENEMYNKSYVSSSNGENGVEPLTATDSYDNVNETENVYPNSNEYESQKVAESTYQNFNNQVDNNDGANQGGFSEMQYANQRPDNAPIKKTIEYKKCSNCGALVSGSAETCFACGHKFNH